MNNIILCGFMGAGKTTVGKELAKIMKYDFIDMDEMIEKEQKTTIKEIFEKHGEKYFRELEYKMCEKVANTKKTIISTGGGTMVYERNVQVMKENNIVIFINTSYSVICERISSENTRPLFQDKEKAEKLYKERKQKYLTAADYTVDGDKPAEEIALAIAKFLTS